MARSNSNEKKTSVGGRVARAGGWLAVKRLARSVPFAGTIMVVGLAGQTIRKKGLVNGAIDVGLDLVPFVGTSKTVVEIFTGDLIPDKDKNQKNGKK